jgi:hypothetical protein
MSAGSDLASELGFHLAIIPTFGNAIDPVGDPQEKSPSIVQQNYASAHLNPSA